MKRGVLLLSGGLDSAVTGAIAKADGFDIIALSIAYGQRHRCELDAARNIARALGVREHRILELDLRGVGGSALTAEIAVPKDHDPAAAEIPVTYVPARNTIFLSLALGLAEAREARDMFIGANAVDYSGYPDCRPEFIAGFERLANLATKAGVEATKTPDVRSSPARNASGPTDEDRSGFRVHAPLIALTKPEIIRRGLDLGVDFSLTRSCYDPDAAGRACGHCDSCQLRLRAFAAIGRNDPAPYQ
ncbi:MAG: 7-cyano-7-deazaguanine synthase QueC [Phycisphaerae bacterium]|nr:7-cyano-7-deazaguanine synthase QueC [Phycisphaerae bacterium]